MNDAKALCLPLQPLVKLRQKYCPKDDAAVKSMKAVPYVSGYSSLVDAMVATRSDRAMQIIFLHKKGCGWWSYHYGATCRSHVYCS